MSRRFSSDPQVDKSLRHSLHDGVAYSVMNGGGENYFSAFALYFKATVAEIGVLAALPPLVGSFFQLVSVKLGHYAGNRRTVIMWGAGLQVLSWLPLTLLPILFPKYALLIILASLVLFYAAGNLITPQWTSLMGDLVPERHRGRYFSHRSRLASITGLIALVGGGLVLQVFSDSLFAVAGFIAIFTMAAVARLVSAYHMACMVDPPLRVRPEPLRNWYRRWAGTPAMSFTGFVALMQFSVAIAGPFFTVYMLRELKFSYVQFMANIAVSVLAQFVTLRAWGRVGDAFGHRLVLLATGFVLPVVPALWILSGDFGYLIGVQVLSGIAWGGFTLSCGNVLYDLVPGCERVPYLAMHNVAIGVATFFGAAIGGWLGIRLPDSMALGPRLWAPESALCVLFLISAVARLITAAAFLPRLRETRVVRVFSWRRLAFRVTGAKRWLRRPAARPSTASGALVNRRGA